MRRFRTARLVLLVALGCFLPGLSTDGTGRLHAQGESGCPLVGCLLVPLCPWLPGPALCPLPPSSDDNAAPRDPPTPVVKLKVRVAAQGKPGEPIEYNIRVANDSQADAHHVVVKNLVPGNARFVRASPEPHAKAPELEWRFGTMKAGTGCDITLVLQPTNLEDVRNCTRVSFEHGICVTTRLAALPGELQPGTKAPEIVPVPKLPTGKEPPVGPGTEKAPTLSLSIDGPKTQYLNLKTSYFITVKNTGKAAATNLLVDFALAGKATFVQASDDGKHLEGKVAWVLGTLEPGASRSVVVALTSPVAGELCHKATALADKGAKAQAEFCTQFQGVSALLLEMVDTEDPIPVGGATSYPIMVRNTGTAPVTNLRLKAIIPDSLTLTRAKAAVNHNLADALPGAKVLAFDPLPTLEPGAQADYIIFVQGAKPADARLRIVMTADQLEGGPVIEEESTRIYAEDQPTPANPLPPIRSLSLTLPYRP
jgi:uncharacterized repeat protein (TIGR01451 family)